MPVLSDEAILAALDVGQLEIEPFDANGLTPNGYDLRIGEIALVGEEPITEDTLSVPPQARFAVSSIHVNCWFGDWDKLGMSERLLDALGLAREACVYVGDSPNDAPMFRAFELSVGVASVADYGDLLEHAPRYVTESDGGAGFAEVVAHLTRSVTK